MTIEDGVATIEDIDKGAATVTVAPVPAAGTPTPPAADSAQVAPVATPTEAQDGADPGTEQPKPAEGDEPEWFKKRLKDISRQRRNEERRADRLAAELEQVRKQVQPATQPKAPEPRQQDFQDYAAFTRAQAEHAARETVRAEIEAATKANAEREAAQAGRRSIETFMEKATAQAEEADIDLDAVMETLSAQPLLSPTVMEHLASSESAAKMAEFLALNPGELQRVSMMGPTLARKELAKLEAGLKPAAAKPPATKAPPIGPTVGGRGITQKSVKDMDMDQFADHFMAEQEARLKRM
jgi:flagellar biosynthesis GTPase FlhF